MSGPKRSVVARAVAASRELGPICTLMYGADRALARRWGVARLFPYAFVAQPVPQRPLVPPGMGGSLAVRAIGPGDPVLVDMDVPAEILAERYRQPTVCLGAFRRDSLIGQIWLCLGAFEEDEVRCRFVPRPAERVAWDFGLYVRPEHRSGVAFAKLWDAANDFLRARGVEWSLSRISLFNPASVRAHARLGARTLGRALFVTRGTMQVMMATVAPYMSVSFRTSDRPTVELWVPAVPAG